MITYKENQFPSVEVQITCSKDVKYASGIVDSFTHELNMMINQFYADVKRREKTIEDTYGSLSKK